MVTQKISWRCQEVSGDSGNFRGVSGYLPKGSRRTRVVRAVSGAPHFNTGGFHGSFRRSQARYRVLRGFQESQGISNGFQKISWAFLEGSKGSRGCYRVILGVPREFQRDAFGGLRGLLGCFRGSRAIF